MTTFCSFAAVVRTPGANHRVKTKDCDRPTGTPLVSCDSDAF